MEATACKTNGNNGALLQTNVTELGEPRRGKVRDIYRLLVYLLIVATDRISAFDQILPTGVPDKGKILTQISIFWFDLLKDIVPNHFVHNRIDNPVKGDWQRYYQVAEELEGRSMLVHIADPLKIECIVRGYLSGSAWKEYRKTGMVCGIKLPTGLVESHELPEPIFTPSTKEEGGKHDRNILIEEAEKIVGTETARKAEEISLKLYKRMADHAKSKGIILADTKFEFGHYNGSLMLIDEVGTPDSSRYWPADQYRPGGPQPSFDKQYVRDFLNKIGFSGQCPAPELPEEIVLQTSAKYHEAYLRLTGYDLMI